MQRPDVLRRRENTLPTLHFEYNVLSQTFLPVGYLMGLF